MIISQMQVRQKPMQQDFNKLKRSSQGKPTSVRQKVDKGTGDQALHSAIYGLDPGAVARFQREHMLPKTKMSSGKDKLWQIVSDEVSTSNLDIDITGDL